MANNSRENSNTIYNTIKTVAGIVFPLVSAPYILRVLQAENVGKISFGSSVISYFSLIASLGVYSYAIRECAKMREDRKALSRIASEIYTINMISTGIAYLALAIALVVFRPLHDYRLLIVIQSAMIVFSTIGTEWINTAVEDFRYITLRTVLMQVLSLLAMFIFIRRPEDYLLYAVIGLVSSSGSNLLNVFYRKKYCDIRLVRHPDLKKHLPPIILLFSMLISQTIYSNSDMTMLGLMQGDAQVGLYSTSVRIYNPVNTLVASIAWVVMPKLSAAFARKNYEEINRLVRYALNYIVVLGLPCITGINCITPQIITVLGGKEYLPAVTSLRILTLSLAFSFIGGWIGNIMMLPAGQEKICLRSGIFSAVLNVVLNLVLIPRFGLNAAAATTALSEFAGIIYKLPYIDKKIRLNGIAEVLVSPAAGCAAVIAVTSVVKCCTENAFLTLLMSIVFSVPVYASVLLLMKNQFFIDFIRPVINKIYKRT